jgi:hypothetical protein
MSLMVHMLDSTSYSQATLPPNDKYWSSDGEKVIHIPGAGMCEQGGDETSSKECV